MARDFVRGSSQYLSNANAAITAAPFSISAWFQWDGVADNHSIVSIGDSTGGDCWLFYMAHAVDDILYFLAIDSGTNQAKFEFTAGAGWHHGLGVEVSAIYRTVYLDGVAGTVSTVNLTPDNANYTSIGMDARNGQTNHYDGRIAEVAIWNAALTPIEAAVLATGASPLSVRPQSRVSYWPLIGRTSPEIDIVGGYDMTLNNGPTTVVHPPVRRPVSPQIIHVPTVGVDRLPQKIYRPISEERTRLIAAFQL